MAEKFDPRLEELIKALPYDRTEKNPENGGKCTVDLVLDGKEYSLVSANAERRFTLSPRCTHSHYCSGLYLLYKPENITRVIDHEDLNDWAPINGRVFSNLQLEEGKSLTVRYDWKLPKLLEPEHWSLMSEYERKKYNERKVLKESNGKLCGRIERKFKWIAQSVRKQGENESATKYGLIEVGEDGSDPREVEYLKPGEIHPLSGYFN